MIDFRRHLDEEQARGNVLTSQEIIAVDKRTAQRFEQAQTQIMQTPVDPSTLPGPKALPFYRRRWFWLAAGVGTFALIYSSRQQD